MEGPLICAIVLFGLIILIVLFHHTIPEKIHDNWDFYFPDVQFSSQEFYDSVEEILKEREVPNTTYTRIELSERGGIFEQQRMYLRVRCAPYSFDICAATYGKGFFTSWWFGEDIGFWKRLLSLIPFFGRYFKRQKEKTYFILDSESMFMQAIHEAVLDTIDDLSSEKGFRKLTELERRYNKLRRR